MYLLFSIKPSPPVNKIFVLIKKNNSALILYMYILVYCLLNVMELEKNILIIQIAWKRCVLLKWRNFFRNILYLPFFNDKPIMTVREVYVGSINVDDINVDTLGINIDIMVPLSRHKWPGRILMSTCLT